MTVGARLRQRRQAKGLSLEEVSRATKIHLNVLTLIETDRASASLNPVYLKGFLKTYGGYLGEDVPALLALLPAPPSVPARPAVAVGRAASGKPPAARAAAAAVRGLAHGLRRLPWRPVAAAAAVLAVLWAGGARLGAMRRRTPRTPPPASSAANAPVKSQPPRATPRKRASAQTPATAVTKQKTPAAPTATAAGEPIRLTMRVHAMTWMQVKADGVVVAQQVLQPGARETWLAHRDITLWLGDAGGVSLELNGRPLGVPGKRGEVVRALRVTAAGIQR